MIKKFWFEKYFYNDKLVFYCGTSPSYFRFGLVLGTENYIHIGFFTIGIDKSFI